MARLSDDKIRESINHIASMDGVLYVVVDAVDGSTCMGSSRGFSRYGRICPVLMRIALMGREHGGGRNTYVVLSDDRVAVFAQPEGLDVLVIALRGAPIMKSMARMMRRHFRPDRQKLIRPRTTPTQQPMVTPVLIEPAPASEGRIARIAGAPNVVMPAEPRPEEFRVAGGGVKQF